MWNDYCSRSEQLKPEISKEDFKQYVKKQYGYDIEFINTGKGDTFEDIFGQKQGKWIEDGYGVECSECGKWYPHKIIDKMISISVIEDIKKELHEAIFRYTVSKERYARGDVEWSEYLLNAEEVFAIIDKHIDKKKENR